jgi:hypothetical protein
MPPEYPIFEIKLSSQKVILLGKKIKQMIPLLDQSRLTNEKMYYNIEGKIRGQANWES